MDLKEFARNWNVSMVAWPLQTLPDFCWTGLREGVKILMIAASMFTGCHILPGGVRCLPRQIYLYKSFDFQMRLLWSSIHCYCQAKLTLICVLLDHWRLFRLETLSEDLDYIGLVAGVKFSSLTSHVSRENTTRLSLEYFQQAGIGKCLTVILIV